MQQWNGTSVSMYDMQTTTVLYIAKEHP